MKKRVFEEKMTVTGGPLAGLNVSEIRRKQMRRYKKRGAGGKRGARGVC